MSEDPYANSPAEGRRLAAIVFTDVVGYSARMQRDETGTMALVTADFARMREFAAHHHGEVLKSTGDGLLLCFESVVHAVACALQVQREFAARPPGSLQHRIGIHLGDVFRASGDVTGDGVNLAARLQTRAQPGTVCISQSVYDAVKGKLPMQVEPLGRTRFKNIAEPIPVFLVRPAEGGASGMAASRRWAFSAGLLVVAGALGILLWEENPGAAPAPAPVTAAPSAAAGPKSIAVLPFENMSDDRANAFFADGVHEDVLTNLSFIPDLRVVSRTSVMQYRGTTKSIRQIGRELGVAYILEGSVRREGGKVRVTGQLVDARSDVHLWAKAYDRDLNDIFGIQSDLAQAIAGALRSVISPEAKAILSRRPTENTEAYDDYLKARQILRSADFWEDEPRAVSLLEDAERLDSNFAAAWAALASQEAFAYFNFEQTEQHLALAKQAIDNAVRLAPEDPTSIQGLGDYYYFCHRAYSSATEQYLRLEKLRPNNPEMYYYLGLVQRRQGRMADGISNCRQALRLDPTNGGYTFNLVSSYLAVRRYDEAEAVTRRFIGEHPQTPYAEVQLGRTTFMARGSTAEMKAYVARETDPSEGDIRLLMQKGFAVLRGDWAGFARMDLERRYVDTDPSNPRWNQDVFAAESFAESGDTMAARSRAVDAMVLMKAELARQPENSQLWASMSLAHALMGDKEEALRSAKRSAEILPESRDAILGPQNSCTCALALAWTGDRDGALAEIGRLLHVPWGLNIYAARLSFRPLREDPRFRELVSDPKNNEPLL